MSDQVDIDAALVYSVPMRTRFRGTTVREGVLIPGPAGWGEFSPFPEYDDEVCVPWLAAAVEACTGGWPEPVRDRIPVNATVPAVSPQRAHEITAAAGCGTVKVKVAEHPASLAEDLERVEAVRDAVGPDGRVRVDANGGWDADTAITTIPQLDTAAGGLEYVEQPCPSLAELAAVRRRVDVRIAADESIRRAEDPLRVAVAGAADVAVIKCAPLGGVRRSLRVAEAAGLPCVISSALETSVGMAAGLALAAAMPELDFACGLATLGLLDGDVVPAAESLRAENGRLPVLRRPPAPDPVLLDGSAAADADRAAWWRARLGRVAARSGLPAAGPGGPTSTIS